VSEVSVTVASSRLYQDMYYWLHVTARCQVQFDNNIARFLHGQAVMLGTVRFQKLELGGVILIPNPPIRRNSTEVHDKECTDSTAWITLSLQSLVALWH